MDSEEGGLWVFGYGSLLWCPGFEYRQKKLGFVKGYARRFWQGNDTHRGTPQKLGRVATLVKDEQAMTWGCAFQLKVTSADMSLQYLNNRESQLGGYSSTFVQFQPDDCREAPIPALTYIAFPNNRLYLGPAPPDKIAMEVITSKGPSGSNLDYVIKLAEYMREYIPNAWDDHLHQLEGEIRKILRLNKMADLDLQDKNGGLVSSNMRRTEDECCSYRDEETRDYDSAGSSSPEYQDRIPSTKLRCLDI